ncbi:MAG: radical SAM family heme chaperone HemW [Nitrospinales bacterium]
MSGLGLYIHIPYCLHKCGYCDFNSHPVNSGEMDAYSRAVMRELAHYGGGAAAGREIATIFLGGGTPTTLPVSSLEKILESCRQNFSVRADAEVTLEANPATIPRQDLTRLRTAGYNRISIGAQSFNPRELKFLERVHGVEEIHATVRRARQGGFDNLSLDLMFALPGQSAEDWGYSLDRVLAENPEHISTYNLTLEPGTAFYKRAAQDQWHMPAEDHQLTLYKQSIRTLKAAGYRHYEISNFARPGRESRHNLNYWENGEYLGIGAGASSFLAGRRFKNYAPPSRYIREVQSRGDAVESNEHPGKAQAMGETMMLGLRLLKGVDLKQFENRFQVSFSKTYGPAVAALLQKKLIALKNNRISLSQKGLYLADSVILEFIA